jgi:1-acyl-sn-glycerol-3-phosphate acyltransferase
MKKKKQKKWMKVRHRVIRNLAYGIIGTYTKWKYGVTVEKFKEETDRPYLILFNHQTGFDQFIVGMAFDRPVYYVASEDLFSNGFVSKLLRWAVAPIPIRKQTTDLNAVMNCIRIAREGGTIAMAPEGNRTFSGETIYMSDAVAPLAKKMKLPIALYRLEGGYGVQPRWSDVVRKGKMRSYVSRVIEPEEYATLSNEELFDLIKSELYVDESVADACFRSNQKAEYLERAMYVCPFCGLTTYESHGNEITCKTCNRTVTYGEDKSLKGVGFDFPFPFVKQWYQHQESVINALDVLAHTETPLYTDQANLSEVIVYKNKKPIAKNLTLELYGDKLVLTSKQGEKREFLFSETNAITILGKNKLNIYHGKHIYQLKGNKRFNALKYVNIFHRYKNITKGEEQSTFLGL